MNEDVDVREERDRDDETVRDAARGMARERATPSRDRMAEERVGDGSQRVDGDGEADRATLFAPDRAEELRSRWRDVQGKFVDDPREAVKAADSLVEEVVRDLSDQFGQERARLEDQWGRNDKVSTEDLRVALRRYRSFFQRLLSV